MPAVLLQTCPKPGVGGHPDQHAQPRGLGPGPRGLRPARSGVWGLGRQAPITRGEVATATT